MMANASGDRMEHKTINEKMRATLIYDGTCPICSSTVTWIEENEKDGSFEMVPCQSEALDKRFPDVKLDECMKAMHLVLPDGKILGGEQALPEIFRRLSWYRPVALLFRLPGMKVLSRIFYRWFADRRYRISHFFHLTVPKK
jgi:predicted DCC family thiol-disulfide oxidoreductase YuxK